MTNSTVSGNTGGVVGGMYLPYMAYTAEIRNSTLTGNVASSGPAGAILVGELPSPIMPLNLPHLRSTITASARTALQALHLPMLPLHNLSSVIPAPLNLRNLRSTMVANARAALQALHLPITPSSLRSMIATNGLNAVLPPAPLNLTSTIAANSTSSPGTVDIARTSAGAATVNAANSLIENPGTAINGTSTDNIFGADPLLGPLQNNGGRTNTHALLPGSPAIDTGDNPSGLATDQRGPGYVRTSGRATDIGAYEVQAPVDVPTLSKWGTAALAALLGGLTLLTGLGRRRRNG